MNRRIDNIEFNLTNGMVDILISFIKIKDDLVRLKKLYKLNKDKLLLIKINDLEYKLEKLRKKFIKQFRLNNKEQIKKYLENKY